MALIEKVWKDWVVDTPGPKFHPVEAAQMGKSSALWFRAVPPSAHEDEQSLRNRVCRNCMLYSGSDGDFSPPNPNLMEIIVYQRQCTGIYLHDDEDFPLPAFRNEWWLQAVAPRGTFSHPDPRAKCATLKARP